MARVGPVKCGLESGLDCRLRPKTRPAQARDFVVKAQARARLSGLGPARSYLCPARPLLRPPLGSSSVGHGGPAADGGAAFVGEVELGGLLQHKEGKPGANQGCQMVNFQTKNPI
jgi:hypothetical protein